MEGIDQDPDIVIGENIDSWIASSKFELEPIEDINSKPSIGVSLVDDDHNEIAFASLMDLLKHYVHDMEFGDNELDNLKHLSFELADLVVSAERVAERTEERRIVSSAERAEETRRNNISAKKSINISERSITINVDGVERTGTFYVDEGVAVASYNGHTKRSDIGTDSARRVAKQLMFDLISDQECSA